MNATEPEDARTDPLVDEVREIREKICQQFGNDVGRLCDHLRELEHEHPERLVDPGAPVPTQVGKFGGHAL